MNPAAPVTRSVLIDGTFGNSYYSSLVPLARLCLTV
jgi:hypothetical protein